MIANTTIRIVVCSLFGLAFALDASAEPLFRGMRLIPNSVPPQPVQGTAFANTEVRPQDVVTYKQNEQDWLNPQQPNGTPQGLSVSIGEGCNLPANNRPKSPSTWNGAASSTMEVWTVDSAALGAELQYLLAVPPPNHGVIAPIEAMPLAQYQTALTTVAWVRVPPPDPADACPGAGVVPHDQLESDVLAVLGAPPVDTAALESAILAANQSGVSRSEILATLTTIGSRLDDAGDEETSNHVWDLYDRIVGFCGPHACLNLR